jgi:CRP-like cAMP-binding protein
MPSTAQGVRAADGAADITRSPSARTDPSYLARGNLLLDRLPAREFNRLQPLLQPLFLSSGHALGLDGAAAAAIFPVQAILSLRTRHTDGCAVEFANVGREGCFGFALLSNLPSPGQAITCSAGLAFALPAQHLIAEFERKGEFAQLMLDQGASLLAQAALLCGCHRRHALERQLARWLLTNFDRLQDNELIVTQEMIASLLGVRREGITEAACHFQREGLIEYRRGHIRLLRRDELAARACECYGTIRDLLERSAR